MLYAFILAEKKGLSQNTCQDLSYYLLARIKLHVHA